MGNERRVTTVVDGDGAGEAGLRQLTAAHDWSRTSVGPIGAWPASLRTLVEMLLAARHPMLLFWGPDLVQFYNDAFRPSLGIGRHPAALGQRARDFWADAWPVIGSQIEGVVTRGESTWNENFLVPIDRNGRREEVYWTYGYSPVSDESGRVAGVLVVVNETTGAVIGQRRLRTLGDLTARTAQCDSVEQVDRAVVDVLADNPADLPFAMVYRVDDGRTTATLAAHTTTRADLPDKLDLEATDPDGSRIARVAQTGTPERCNVRIASSVDAEPPPAVTEALLLPLAQQGSGQPIGVLAAGISPSLPLDGEYHGFLTLVADRIATAVANARAHEAERQRAEALAELDRAKTQFFSNVSHEFRTPLTLMLGPLQDSLDDEEHPLPQHQRERVEIIQRSALRLLRLVNTLLEFSRIEAGRYRAIFEPTDLAVLTADLASTFRSAIERAGMSLIVDTERDVGTVHVDRDMWEKIVLNLLSNAFKYTLDGEIRVTLSREGRHARLDVRDTGVGIPAEEIPHVFDRFRRVEGVTGRALEGSGIGLALVRELVKLHGGDVTVESDPGVGSVFSVLIPIGTAHLPAEQVREQSGTRRELTHAATYRSEAEQWLIGITGSRPGTPMTSRVLVADDNGDMREYIARLLAPLYSVRTVSDGQAALEAIRRDRPDVVVADVMMPRLDGFALLEAIRADVETRSIPVILLSARAGEESRVEGLNAGADDYLVKPFSARELLARIGTHLDIARMHSAAGDRERALRREAEQRTREAEEANAAKASFLAHMSHELRTPLNAIIGYSDLLDAEIAGPLLPAQRQQLQRITTGARHLLMIIQEILTFSRMEAGHESVNATDIDLAELIRETAELAEPLAAARSLSFSCRAPETLPAWTDGGKVRQILLNIIGNAVKFTEAGEIRLTADVAGDVVVLRVSDTGIGIGRDHLENIFEPFRQIEPTLTRRSGGTGLGLSVTRQLTHLLGGDVSVESEPGRGSTFTVRLPLRAPDPAP